MVPQNNAGHAWSLMDGWTRPSGKLCRVPSIRIALTRKKVTTKAGPKSNNINTIDVAIGAYKCVESPRRWPRMRQNCCTFIPMLDIDQMHDQNASKAIISSSSWAS